MDPDEKYEETATGTTTGNSQPHADFLTNFYGVEKLMLIKWAHACNTLEKLKTTLDENLVHYIEVDVRLRQHELKGEMKGPPVVVLSHDPTTQGQPFDEWLAFLLQSNKMAKKKFGVKLDFKEMEAVVPAIKIVERCIQSVDGTDTPFILNADVIQGPRGDPPSINGEEFIHTCLKHFPSAVLSLGWTSKGETAARDCVRRTCYNLFRSLFESGETTEARYTKAMVDDMFALVRKQHIEQLTFPVRACYVRPSWDQLQRLLNHPFSTLTVFAGIMDNKDGQWIVSALPHERTFLDGVDYQ